MRCSPWIASMCGLVALGCSQQARDQLSDKLSQAKEQVSSKAQELSSQAADGASRIAESVRPDGQAQLKLDSELRFSASYLTVIPVGDRGGVLLLRSYAEPASESYPSYYFHAQVTAGSVTQLQGRMIEGRLLVKPSPTEATWVSISGEPVSVLLTGEKDGKVVGEFTGGNLHGADGRSLPVSGSFEAVPWGMP